MSKSVAQKIGAKEGMRSIFVGAPENAIPEINAAHLDLKKKLQGKFDYIHLFVQTQSGFHKQFPRLKKHLQPAGMLWVSWPKGGLNDTDLNIKIVIKMGYDYGLVESKAISVNETWSALKFTWPREKVNYKNSFGKLR